jgi:N-acetyl-gamma-glutamyl-phosphate reductase
VITVGIVGGTGYTGVELLRVLVMHPEVELAVITSRSEAGQRVDSLYPNLRGYCDLVFSEPNGAQLARCDVIFFATPHGVAQAMMAELWQTDARIIDLSADFRIRDAALWEHWYAQPHACPELIAEAVYGLPERNRASIAEARLIACPGCYPTSVQLGFMPLLEAGLIDIDGLIANSVSAVSGAGRQAKIPNLFAEMGESFKAYGVAGHRHSPEIAQELSAMAAQSVGVTFVPHLAPMTRGIHSTLYARLRSTDVDLQDLYQQRYADEPFVDVMPAGSFPETRSVRGSNLCRLAVYRPGEGDTVVVLSVIDNLAKGASTQAVQNMNIMFGLPEDTSLRSPAIMP